MRYYKIVKEDKLIEIGIGLGGEKITKAEYEVLKSEIETKAKEHMELINGYVASINKKEITIDDVPTEHREEVEYMLTPAEQKPYTQEQYDAVLISLIEEGVL